MKLKEIRVYPSTWYLDVIVARNDKDLIKISESRYGLKCDPLITNQCASVDSNKESKLKGERRVVLTLKTLQHKHIIVHELIHVLWHISMYIGYEMQYETNEWQAILAEYLYEQICDKNGYVEYDSSKH